MPTLRYFFPAMLHTDSIITAAGLPRMSFQAGLLDLAAYFAIVRLLGPCSVGAVYKKHQQDGKGSHDDLLSCCDFLVRNPRTLARLFRCFHELLRAFSIVLRSVTLNRSQLREKVQRHRNFSGVGETLLSDRVNFPSVNGFAGATSNARSFK